MKIIVALLLVAVAAGQGPDGPGGSDFTPPLANAGASVPPPSDDDLGGPDGVEADPPAAVGGSAFAAAPAAAAAAAGEGEPNPCECQCNSYTYTSRVRGRTQTNGNCNSLFRGRQWCYINYEARSQCRDTAVSNSGRAYSWEACKTPTRSDSKCSCLANGGLTVDNVCSCMCPPGSPNSCYDYYCVYY